ncbi:MAG: hypothetical protein KME57_33670 [Scytonema hyalinum WJT4-NPBG1]|jgi:hypothetical protein|nr:hypothetical protein [Scytonema hyalinum WJT4-NPBG1]
MSLTSELKNKESPIRKWFDDRYNTAVAKIITTHNQLLSQQEIIQPVEGTDFPLTGNALSKALSKYLGLIYNQKNWYQGCTPLTGAQFLKVEYAFDYCITESKSLEEEALKCMILSALENYVRTRKIHEIIQPFLQGENYLNLEAEYFRKWLPTIQDTAQIIGILPRTWETVKSQIIPGKIICNGSFPLSGFIGGADYQVLVGNTLIDIRTTAKRRPFTLDNFYQQISYCLLDSNNTYKINQLVWFYSRQESAFCYPISKLFHNLKATREEFKKMILANYGYDSKLNSIDNKLSLNPNLKLYLEP